MVSKAGGHSTREELAVRDPRSGVSDTWPQPVPVGDDGSLRASGGKVAYVNSIPPEFVQDVVRVPVKDHIYELKKREADMLRARDVKLDRLINRSKVPIKFKNSLVWQAYRQGIDALEKEGVSVKGWSKCVSVLLTAGSRAEIAEDFNLLAGWNDTDTIDAYNLGVVSCVDGTEANKLSYIRGFLCYVHSFEKGPPWTLEDVFSYHNL